ncbi:hypothetical protein DPMN_102094 [Dreissena polymorpha]|uniref:Uncharacterized protein n=1 Tax=Dreissena polymorpha TaxID=45954 RepID=A0A9D4LKH7_DREPO|nr:hypothetical protein DPMN_102094 [Dreissena polymorpha]
MRGCRGVAVGVCGWGEDDPEYPDKIRLPCIGITNQAHKRREQGLNLVHLLLQDNVEDAHIPHATTPKLNTFKSNME